MSCLLWPKTSICVGFRLLDGMGKGLSFRGYQGSAYYSQSSPPKPAFSLFRILRLHAGGDSVHDLLLGLINGRHGLLRLLIESCDIQASLPITGVLLKPEWGRERRYCMFVPNEIQALIGGFILPPPRTHSSGFTQKPNLKPYPLK